MRNGVMSIPLFHEGFKYGSAAVDLIPKPTLLLYNM